MKRVPADSRRAPTLVSWGYQPTNIGAPQTAFTGSRGMC